MEKKNQLKQIKQEKKRMGIIGTILINHNVPSTKEKCQKLLSLTVNYFPDSFLRVAFTFLFLQLQMMGFNIEVVALEVGLM